MHAAVLADMALDDGALVHDLQLVFVGGDFELVDGDDGDDGEERARRLPAFGTAAGVVVGDVGTERHLDFGARAVAVEGSALEIGGAFAETVVYEGVERGCHFGLSVFKSWD